MLALVILCDQLPRKCYRNSAQEFDFDSIALQVSEQFLSEKRDIFNMYTIYEKEFILMPFRHSEKAEDQIVYVKELNNLRFGVKMGIVPTKEDSNFIIDRIDKCI